jgi:NAD+ kinase
MHLFFFLTKNNVDLVIEYFSRITLLFTKRDSPAHHIGWIVVLSIVSIGVRRNLSATLCRDSGVPILGINAGRLGFSNRPKEDIDSFLQIVIDKNIRYRLEHAKFKLRPAY